MPDFLGLAIGITLAILGIVIAAEMLAGVFPALTSALTTLNATGNATSGEHLLPLRSLIAPGGVIALLVVAVFVIGTIMLLIAMFKKKGR